MASIKIDRDALTKVFQGAAVKWANEMGQRVVNEAKAGCPVDTGRLRSSIAYTINLTPSTCELKVGSDLPYARYIVEGTGVYGPKHRPIVPTTKQALKFPTPKGRGPLRAGAKAPKQSARGFVFAKSVKGRPPNDFFSAALRAVFGSAVRETGSN